MTAAEPPACGPCGTYPACRCLIRLKVCVSGPGRDCRLKLPAARRILQYSRGRRIAGLPRRFPLTECFRGHYCPPYHRAAGITNGADILVQSLINHGVDVIFAYPGGASMPLHQSLTKFKDQIRTILPRHEQGGRVRRPGLRPQHRQAGRVHGHKRAGCHEPGDSASPTPSSTAFR